MQKQLPETTITVPVPDHSELRIGNLQSIIRQSSVPREAFENVLPLTPEQRLELDRRLDRYDADAAAGQPAAEAIARIRKRL